MIRRGCILKLLLLALNVVLLMSNSYSQGDEKEYIVYMGDRLKDVSSTASLYLSMLRNVISSNVAPDSVLYSYRRSFSGFVVRLTEEQARNLAEIGGVVSVFPNKKYSLQTTRSWDFLGFPEQVRRATMENDIIIGVLDTGIWPGSDSFSDAGLGPPPSKWKGSCQSSANFTCNNKIIGAKYYRVVGPVKSPEDVLSPLDTEGHGTHVASTAAGRSVASASLYGLGSGTARGGVPSARIAVYKICWSDGCYGADILAAFDNAIADGVDIISLSVGNFFINDFYEDPIAIGAFYAMKNNVLTSNSGGNNGPSAGSITSVAPWLLSVAASTIDRKFLTKVQLANGNLYEVIDIHTYIYICTHLTPTNLMAICTLRYCRIGTLDPNLVQGKIVVCDTLTNGNGPFSAGAKGAIMHYDFFLKDVAFSFPLPVSYLDDDKGIDILRYINSSRNASASIFKSMEVNDTVAPYVVSFSSRGPNLLTPGILKPDLSAPGVDILAGWTMAASITGVPGDNRFSPFNIISGTSMACPHASAAAAYIKSFNPTWSPAAIKSALMTTATPMKAPTNSSAAEFAYGTGNINPLKAVNPGLVYDANQTDYVKFLCGQGYNKITLRIMTGDDSTCSNATNGTVWDLNYPSFTLPTASVSTPIDQIFTRTVTNVGDPTSTYRSVVSAPAGLSIQVVPEALSFNSLGQKLSFNVTVGGSISRSMVSASLVWDDGVHQVRSPIVVYVVASS
ncbi:hypothetical protein SAY86_009315 [Trapa natans]|uniref:Cucumisin n=1 Tax=Trapa natans TaxID=22666 RepID=A0AAN7QSX3_TRANT|nr:hypothetical protein SAY86_009315 [Trapa natans]